MDKAIWKAAGRNYPNSPEYQSLLDNVVWEDSYRLVRHDERLQTTDQYLGWNETSTALLGWEQIPCADRCDERQQPLPTSAVLIRRKVI